MFANVVNGLLKFDYSVSEVARPSEVLHEGHIKWKAAQGTVKIFHTQFRLKHGVPYQVTILYNPHLKLSEIFRITFGAVWRGRSSLQNVTLCNIMHVQ